VVSLATSDANEYQAETAE